MPLHNIGHDGRGMRTRGEVVCFRKPGTQEPFWKVVWDQHLLTPDFQSKGAAQAYLAMLNRGERQPEYVT